MRDEHIIGILDGAPLRSLSEGELARVRAHAAGCDACRRAFEAAGAASALLRERAAETFEPSPFFQTRVLAALRERRAEEAMPALRRLWRSAGALVSSMAATVALLAVFSFVAPQFGLAPAADEELATVSAEAYPAEAALFVTDEAGEEEMDYEQVFRAVYTSGDSDE
jgi:predicted anti-sigma-YlaC factor YlaD